MLSCVCSVIDHRRRQNVVRTSVTHSAIAWCATFLFLPHFDVICDLLMNRLTTWNPFGKMNRRTATWNLLALFNIDTNKNVNHVIYAVNHKEEPIKMCEQFVLL